MSPIPETMPRLLCAALLAFGLAACKTAPDPAAPGTSGTDAAASTGELTPEQITKGIGPITTVELGATPDEAMAAKGEEAFTMKCASCHKFGERYVGPDLKGITTRRAPEYVMNMVLNPQEMTQKHPEARKLLGEYMTQMTFQNVTPDEARNILEYLRTQDAGS